MIFINGNSAKCYQCKFFAYRIDAPTRKDLIFNKPDGWCSKVFPRGYTNSGRENGWVYSLKSACNLFERNDSND